MARISSNISKPLVAFLIIGLLFLALFTIENSSYLDRSESYVLRSEKPLGFKVTYDLIRELKGPENVNVDFSFSPYNNDTSKYTYIAIDNQIDFEYGYIEQMLTSDNTVIVIANQINGIDSTWVKSDTLAYSIPTYGMIDTFALNDKDSIFVPLEKGFDLPYGVNIKDFGADTVLLYGEDYPILQVRKASEGTLIIHYCPYLFTNFAAKQPHYLDHLKKLTPYLTGKVIFSHPTDTDKSKSSGLLSQILKKPGLKYAYYLMLAMVMLYLFLSGKRIQEIIPVVPSKKNLTASYVDTISRLYQSQDQKKLLLERMRENFFHYVSKHFYITQNDPEFVSQLSKRTSVPEYTIQMILKLSGDDSLTTITDDHISTLNQYIQQFKSIAYNGR